MGPYHSLPGGDGVHSFRPSFRLVFILVLLCLTCPLPAQQAAQRTISIKLASPIPESTPWGRGLNQIAADWKRITNGQVELIIYHNGVAGSEKDVVRSLRLNQLQGAVLSTFGLYEITPEVMTLSCPFLIRDDDELDAVLAGLKNELDAKINDKGFINLAWARVGWVKFFSKSPVYIPADLKRQKLGTNADQTELAQAFRSMGFQMVPVERNDILVALSSNMVDAVFQSPIAVGSTQVFGLAKNMASINVAPFIGGVLINQRTWRSIPDQYKDQMMAAVRRYEVELDRNVRQLEATTIRTMGTYGLVVNQLSPEQEQLWYNEVGQVMPTLIGTLYDRNTYTRIESILRNFRNRRS